MLVLIQSHFSSTWNLKCDLCACNYCIQDESQHHLWNIKNTARVDNETTTCLIQLANCSTCSNNNNNNNNNNNHHHDNNQQPTNNRKPTNKYEWKTTPRHEPTLESLYCCTTNTKPLPCHALRSSISTILDSRWISKSIHQLRGGIQSIAKSCWIPSLKLT